MYNDVYPHYSIQSSLSALKIPALHVFIFPFFPLYKPLAMTSLLQLSPYFCLFHKVAFFKAKHLCRTLAEKPIKSATRNTELLENYFMNNKGRCHLTSISSQRTRIYSWMESWMWRILSEITYVQNKKQILTSVLHIYEGEGLDNFILLQKTYAISGKIFLLLWKVSFNIFMIQEVYQWNRMVSLEQTFFSNLKSQTHNFSHFQCLGWLPSIIYVRVHFSY